MSEPEPSDLLLQINAKLFPRRYRRFRDLRPIDEACRWAETLDWRQNPYDRFLLRRELLRHLESTEIYKGRRNVFSFASRDEVSAEVDRLMNEFPDKFKSMGVFTYVLITLPWHLGFKHGRVRHSLLNKALAKLDAQSHDK